jgi:hypothetical protein
MHTAAAVDAVRTDVGLNKALKSFNVLRSTLKDYAEKAHMMPKQWRWEI